MKISLVQSVAAAVLCFSSWIGAVDARRRNKSPELTPWQKKLRRHRHLQEFNTLCVDLDTIPPVCSASPIGPSCWAARSPSYCADEFSFDSLIQERTAKIQADPSNVLQVEGFWFHLLEDKGAAYLLNAGAGHSPPEVYCCVTDPNDLSTEPLCTGSMTGPMVIKTVDGHSGNGVFVFGAGGVSSDTNSTELLTGQSMSLEDVIVALQSINPSKILVEEFVDDGAGNLPAEYKFHVFGDTIGAVDIIMNRGTECECYAVIDMDCKRLDQQGCFENVEGPEILDDSSCVAVNSVSGMFRAGPLKGSLPLCAADDFVDPCQLAKMAEVAMDLGGTIGAYVRVDMFLDGLDNVRVQEYSTNHMNGLRYCASRVDPITGCLDPCFLGEMWDANGSNKLYGGDATPVPSDLSDWLTLTEAQQCARVLAKNAPGDFVSSATCKPTDAPTSTTSAPTTSSTGSPTSSPVAGTTMSPTTSPTGKPTLAPTVALSPLAVIGENVTMDPNSTFPDIAFDVIDEPVIFWPQSGPPIGPCFALNGAETPPSPSDSLTVVDPNTITNADIGSGTGSATFPGPLLDTIQMALSALVDYDLQTVTQMVNTVTDGTDYGASTDLLESDLLDGAYPPHPVAVLVPPDGSGLSNVVCADPPLMGITAAPSSSPTSSPIGSPTATPTGAPTGAPNVAATASPTSSPTSPPTASPVVSATSSPTSSPSPAPTTSPTGSPTFSPTASPIVAPTTSPTDSPTSSPTPSPTNVPTVSPTRSPTYMPTVQDISGLVFADLSCDGVYNATEDVGTNGVTLSPIQVTAYHSNGTIAGSVTVDINGTFELLTVFPPGQLVLDDALRVEFTNIPLHLYDGSVGGDSQTTIQFYYGPTTEADLALCNPDAYCQQYPDIAIPCFVNGDQTHGDVTIVSLNTEYATQNDAKTPEALDTETGTVYGIAYQRSTKTIFSSAFLKRHTGIGPGGFSAIYKTTVGAGPGVGTALYFRLLNDTNIDVGSNPAGRDLSGLSTPSYDLEAFEAVGKRGIGDIDFDESTSTLWVVNLLGRTVHGITNINPLSGNTPTVSDVVNPGGWLVDAGITCVRGELRPFGLRILERTLYATATCTGEADGGLPGDMQGYVLKIDMDNPGSGFSIVLQFDLDYPRKSWSISQEWQSWNRCTAATWNSDWVACFNPLLSSLDFDMDGSLIIGIMDRRGNQIGPYNYPPIAGEPIFTVEPSAYGDILRACPSGDGETFVIEGSPGCANNNTRPAGEDRVGGYQLAGPGGSEYFVGDWGPLDPDEFEETAQGAVLFQPGSMEVMTTAMDPSAFHSGGILFLDRETGEKKYGWTLYTTPNDPQTTGTFGKANGLGDMELMCDASPLEIGNYVWHDLNQNGIQDPNEPGIPNVEVILVPEDGLTEYQATTDSNGNYYFNDANVLDGGVKSFYNYTLIIDIDQPALSSYVSVTTRDATITLSTIPDSIDSDAEVIGTNATISFRTGPGGKNDHTFDFGFVSP